MKFYPFLLGYSVRDYIWGGTKLIEDWNKKTTSDKIAESWELSVHPKSQSYILNGKLKGCLNDIIEQYPEILGEKGMEQITFPVLVKLINAAKPLSVQVHPDDEYALVNEGQMGKCEMWYVCEAEQNGEIYLGLNQDLTKDEIASSIENNTIEKYLNKIKVNKGEFYLVPTGVLHAIRAGVTLLEIQQNSDVTYRVYDYDRKDDNGKKRELHIDKALNVIDTRKFDLPAQIFNYTEVNGYKVRELVDCKYFKTKEYVISDELQLYNKDSFVAFTVIEGEGFVGKYNIGKGNTVLIPANHTETIKGKLTVITVEL